MSDVTYVTQEQWDAAQEALRAVLPYIEPPPLSMSGTMVSLRRKVEAAIVPGLPDAERWKTPQARGVL